MQQHPIPQNVMQVEFQLVGNLTLRQFGYLAAGGMLTFMIYLLPFPDLIKWPIVLTSAVFFAALVWIPINDMSLDRWVIAFFRAINSPTKRVWHKEPKSLSVFSREYARQILKSAAAPILPDRSRLEGFLKSLGNQAPKSDLDLAEQAYLDSLPFNIGNPPPPPPPPILAPERPAPTPVAVKPPPPPPPPVPEKPPEPHVVEEDLTKPVPLLTSIKPVITVHMPGKNLYVKKVGTTSVNRSLHPLSSLEGTIVLPVRGEKTFELSPEIKERLYPAQTIEQVGEAGINPAPAAPPAEATGGYESTPVPTSAPLSTPTDVKKIADELAAEAAEASQKLKQDLGSRIQGAGIEGQTPKPPTPEPATPPPPAPEVKKPEPAPAAPTPDRSTEKKALPTAAPKVIKSAPSGTAAQPAVGKMAPPPAGMPNVIVGMVRTNSGLLISDAVIIVKDTDGEPVRALKSNKVGQFMISTPLPNGTYTIDFEKEGYSFDTISVAMTGEIFQPIEVRAK